MRVLVTGGAGFIGTNLCRHLVDVGVEHIAVLDDLSSGRAENLDGLDVDLIEGSILDEALVSRLAGEADAVVHLAAIGSVPRSVADPVASHGANATGTLMVMEGARHGGVDQVVVASSSSVYGANPVLPKHEDLATFPLSPYGASKLATETYALAYQHSYGLPVLAFRFFNVFGPYQPAGHVYAAVVPVFIAAALDGVPLPVHGDGRQTRDFTFVSTVTAVIADALERKVVYPEPVNLAYGNRVDLVTLIAMLEQVLGRPLERSHGPNRAGDVPHSQADSSRLRELFPGIEPVALADALQATVEWSEQERGLG